MVAKRTRNPALGDLPVGLEVYWTLRRVERLESEALRALENQLEENLEMSNQISPFSRVGKLRLTVEKGAGPCHPKGQGHLTPIPEFSGSLGSSWGQSLDLRVENDLCLQRLQGWKSGDSYRMVPLLLVQKALTSCFTRVHHDIPTDTGIYWGRHWILPTAPWCFCTIKFAARVNQGKIPEK